jgi:hypothetical protein
MDVGFTVFARVLTNGLPSGVASIRQNLRAICSTTLRKGLDLFGDAR